MKKNTWYSILSAHMFLLLIIIALDSALNIVHSLLPVWLFSSIINHNSFLFITLFCIWIIEILLSACLRIIYTRLEVTITNAFSYNSYQKIFQNNLIFNSDKEVGISVSKIERALQSYKELLSSFIFGIIPTIIRTITVIITVFYYASPIAPYSAFLLTVIAFLHSFLYWHILEKQEKKCIKSQDVLKNFIVTHTASIKLIQASGGTENILVKIKKYIFLDRDNEIQFWRSNAYIHTLIAFLYLISVALISCYFFYALFYEQIVSATALGLLGSYLRSTSGILYLERPLRTTVKAVTDIQDFLSYMQTLPAEQEASHELSVGIKNIYQKTVNIKIKSLSFNYKNKKPLFYNLDMSLEISKDKPHTFYGITGPSGSGKSTFALLLAGYLKPEAGTLLIDEIFPHDLVESERQKLVIIQIQGHYLFIGTLLDRLLLGLPENAYTKVYLLELLKKYNLETVSLDTHEKFSAGQLQKILFINTYLRVLYFKPAVIILDEPTSSLDTLSEEKILVMIEELTQHAVVFVVSHKKELLSRAYMIADFSLLHKEQKINFIPQA